jgi:hypothetical protein
VNTNTNLPETSSKVLINHIKENFMHILRNGSVFPKAIVEAAGVVACEQIELLQKEFMELRENHMTEIERLLNSFQYIQGDAINNAARDLPEDFVIEYCIEKHGCGMRLIDQNGRDVTPELSDDIDEQINDCVEHAKELVKS